MKNTAENTIENITEKLSNNKTLNIKTRLSSLKSYIIYSLRFYIKLLLNK